MLRNRLTYAAVLIIAILALIRSNSPVAVAAVVLLLVIPAVAYGMARLTAKGTELSFEVPFACSVGQSLSMGITATRQLGFLKGRIQLCIDTHNLLMRSVGQQEVTLALGYGNTETYALPMRTLCCGHTVVTLAKACALDPLGLFSVPLSSAAFEGSYTVYPRLLDLSVESAHSARFSLSGFTYDTRRKGSDPTELFDLRDYEQGDALHTIHWKLSSKFDHFVVRESSHPTDYDIVLLCDAHVCDITDLEHIALLNATMSLTASVSIAMCRQGQGHSVAYTDDETLTAQPVDTLASFEEMLDVLMSAPLPLSPTMDTTPFQIYKRDHSVSKTVFITDVINEGLLVNLGELTDLSVLQVTSDDAESYDESGTYLLSHIPVDAVGERIKNVVL